MCRSGAAGPAQAGVPPSARSQADHSEREAWEERMHTLRTTMVRVGADMPWNTLEAHRHLSHRTIVSPGDADRLCIRLSTVLWERIGVGGAVLPHFHDVAEIIHITVGCVRLLRDGEWQTFQAGDTFLVPAGVVHSVENADNAPTEQVSIFLPPAGAGEANAPFQTYLVAADGAGVTG